MNIEDVNKQIQRYYNIAIEYATAFGVTLDFSEDSINKVEEILEYYSNDLSILMKDQKPTQNQIWSMSLIWGSYIGEAMRIKIGEACRWIYNEGEYLLEAKKSISNPIGKVYKRLVNGSEDNVKSFYDIISIKMKEHIEQTS